MMLAMGDHLPSPGIPGADSGDGEVANLLHVRSGLAEQSSRQKMVDR